MPDYDSSNPLGFFFAKAFGTGPQSQSYEALAARRKIAEAMMARQTSRPKNVGEGLSAIGEAIGDRGYYNNVLADDAAQKSYETGKINAPPPPPSSYAPYSPTPAPAPVTAPPPPPRTTGELTTDPAGETAVTPPPAPVADATPPPAGVNPNVASWYAHATKPAEAGGLGLQPHQAAGLVSNLQAESGQGLPSWGPTGDNRTAWGTAQWRGPRLANLRSYAAAKGLDPQSMEAQQAFMRHEMIGDPDVLGSGRGSEAGAYQNLLAAKDPAGAATAFNRTYERSADRSGRREAGAGRVAGLFGGGGPRDQIAAAMTPPAGPMTPQDTAQEATFNDVVGMQKAPTAGYSYPATASRTGDVQSDVAPQGIRPTGGLGGDSPVAASVGDTVQARGDAIKGPMPITPEPNPPPPVGQIQTADATAPRPPGATADATAAAPVTPQGPPQIQPLGDKPAQPQLLPTENARTQHYEAIAADPRLSKQAQDNAKSLAAVERAQISAFNAQKIQEYNFYLQKWLDAKNKREDPSTQLDVYKKQMELTPEQINALSPQEKAIIGDLPAGVRVYKDALGHLKTIMGPQTVSIDQTGEKQESKTGGELAAKRQGEMIEASNKAGENLTTIARAEELLKRIDTNAFAPGNTTLSAMGRAIGVSDDFMRGMGLKPEQIGSRQAFIAIVNELAMGKIGPGGMPSNNFSEGDRKFLTQTQISLGDDPESNRIKLAAARTMAELHIERADRWGDWKEANPGKSYADFERVWNKELKSRNAFGELNRQARELLDRQKDGGQPAVPQPQTPAALPYTDKDKADAIDWISRNQGSGKIPSIKQRYGIP